MIQKIIISPMIDALVHNGDNNDNPDGSFQKDNNILLIGTRFETNYRALIQFDLSALPFFSTIINGTLNIFVAQNLYPDTSSSLGVFQVISEWHPKTLNWSEQPLISASPVDSIRVDNQADTFLTLNVTTLLQDWFSNPSVNMGLMLKFMDESYCNFLAISGKKYCDSRFWPYLELNLLDRTTSEDHRMLRATPLEQSVTVLTLPILLFTVPFNVLEYDYSYLIVNIGGGIARAYLQISPDGTTWETQSGTKTINPSTLVSFVPNVIAKYARLAYQTQPASSNTTLEIYIQGRSYN